MFGTHIAGNKRVVDFLSQGLESGVLHHAYCFVGPDHSGKRGIATALARALMCVTANGCGSCVSCGQANHADLIVLDGETEALSIETVRDWLHALTLTSFGKGRRVGILYHAHVLPERTQNALLKTLEEPPANTTILLTSHTPLIPTIMSRVQMLRMAPRQMAARSEFDSLFLTMAAEGVTNELMKALSGDDAHGTRQRVMAFLEHAERLIRGELIGEKKTSTIFSSQYAIMQALDALRIAIRALAVNADPRLVLETCYNHMFS